MEDRPLDTGDRVNPLVILAVKEVVRRAGVTLVKITLGIAAVGAAGSACAIHTITIEDLQPGHFGPAVPVLVGIVPPAGEVIPIAIDGFVTDAQRFALAVSVGFSATDAITATAISIAEDGSGNPAALSAANFNGTRDLGLWQINSIHWAAYGGQAALTIPINNARAAFGIFGPGRNWCAWSTYEASCGLGHTGSYAAFLGRARAAAQGGN